MTILLVHIKQRGRRGHNRMLVGFTTTCAISAYHHLSCEFEPHSWRAVLDTTLCDKVYQWLATGRCFSSTNKTKPHDITDILLKVALNTISLSLNNISCLREKAFFSFPVGPQNAKNKYYTAMISNLVFRSAHRHNYSTLCRGNSNEHINSNVFLLNGSVIQEKIF